MLDKTLFFWSKQGKRSGVSLFPLHLFPAHSLARSRSYVATCHQLTKNCPQNRHDFRLYKSICIYSDPLHTIDRAHALCFLMFKLSGLPLKLRQTHFYLLSFSYAVGFPGFASMRTVLLCCFRNKMPGWPLQNPPPVATSKSPTPVVVATGVSSRW